MANNLDIILKSDTADITTEDERDIIRQNVSTMSFEDLLKLKQKIGTKLYNTKIMNAESRNKKTPQTVFKRANKNRPREMSSKRFTKLDNQQSVPKPAIVRDPRFDPLCGEFDTKMFKKNYKFVGDLKKKEKEDLEKQFKSTRDPREKEKINFVIKRLTNQIREDEKQNKKLQESREERLIALEKVKRGEKPNWKKKSVKKVENLVEQYENLKAVNKLQKHIEKKSKKLTKKELG